jgi:hypothetical protein
MRGLWKWNFLGIVERGDSNEEEQAIGTITAVFPFA